MSRERLRLMYGRITRIEGTRTTGEYKGQRFYHDFKDKVQAWAVPAGARIAGRKLARRTVILIGARDIWG